MQISKYISNTDSSQQVQIKALYLNSIILYNKIPALLLETGTELAFNCTIVQSELLQNLDVGLASNMQLPKA